MSKSLVIQLNYNLVYFYYLLYCCTFSALLQEVGLENLLIKKTERFVFRLYTYRWISQTKKAEFLH